MCHRRDRYSTSIYLVSLRSLRMLWFSHVNALLILAELKNPTDLMMSGVKIKSQKTDRHFDLAFQWVGDITIFYIWVGSSMKTSI